MSAYRVFLLRGSNEHWTPCLAGLSRAALRRALLGLLALGFTDERVRVEREPTPAGPDGPQEQSIVP